MEIRRDYRPWDALLPDILGLIFNRVPFGDKFKVVPSVCKSWEKAIKAPYCWQEIDIEEWSQWRGRGCIDRMLILLIGRSSGSLEKLCVDGVRSESTLLLIGDNAKNLRNLRLPGSDISNSMAEQLAGKLSNLTSLDISNGWNINAVAIEAIGKHCKQLTYLQRKMDCRKWNVSRKQSDEAFAIAATMPQLKSLELAFMRVTTEGVLRILAKCHELELLNIRGCRYVKLDEKFLRERSKLKVMGPWGHAFIDTEEDDDDSDECDDDYGGECCCCEDFGFEGNDDDNDSEDEDDDSGDDSIYI